MPQEFGTQFDFDAASLSLEFSLLLANAGDKALASRAEGVKEILISAVTAYTDEAERISRIYVEDARPQALGTIREPAETRIRQATENLLADIAATENALRAQIAAPGPDSSTSATLLQIERRNLLRQMDPLVRLEILWASAERGDLVTLDCLRLAAPFDRLVPEHELSKTLEAVGKASFPDAAKRLREILTVKTALESARDSALRKIGARTSPEISFA